jgi:hypothetical protein
MSIDNITEIRGNLALLTDDNIYLIFEIIKDSIFSLEKEAEGYDIDDDSIDAFEITEKLNKYNKLYYKLVSEHEEEQKK